MKTCKLTTLLLTTLTLAGGLIGCAAAPSAKPTQPYARVERDVPTALTPQQRREEFVKAYNVGMSLAEQGDYGGAIGAFQDALKLNPDSTEAWIAVGACHESLGDPIEAVNHYRQALTLNPNESDAYANLGTAYIKLYHRDRNPSWKRMALESWRRSLTLKPDQQDILTYVARVDGNNAS